MNKSLPPRPILTYKSFGDASLLYTLSIGHNQDQLFNLAPYRSKSAPESAQEDVKKCMFLLHIRLWPAKGRSSRWRSFTLRGDEIRKLKGTNSLSG